MVVRQGWVRSVVGVVVVALVASLLALSPWVPGVSGAEGQVPDPGLYPDAVLADEPTAFWRFEEGAGTVASDSVGAIDATLNGAVWSPATGVLSRRRWQPVCRWC